MVNGPFILISIQFIVLFVAKIKTVFFSFILLGFGSNWIRLNGKRNGVSRVLYYSIGKVQFNTFHCAYEATCMYASVYHGKSGFLIRILKMSCISPVCTRKISLILVCESRIRATISLSLSFRWTTSPRAMPRSNAHFLTLSFTWRHKIGNGWKNAFFIYFNKILCVQLYNGTEMRLCVSKQRPTMG